MVKPTTNDMPQRLSEKYSQEVYVKPEDVTGSDLELLSYQKERGKTGEFVRMNCFSHKHGKNIVVSTGANAVMKTIKMLEDDNVSLPIIFQFQLIGRAIYME